MPPLCSVVVSGAPLTERATDVIRALLQEGWEVQVAATAAALDWLDAAAVKELTGYPPQVAFRDPEQPRNGRAVDAIVVVPGTFNTVNKIATGLADNYATYTACTALGSGAQAVVVPMITTQLWGHSATTASLQFLAAAGVTLIDPMSGKYGIDAVAPISIPTFNDMVAGFDPAWVTSALHLPN